MSEKIIPAVFQGESKQFAAGFRSIQEVRPAETLIKGEGAHSVKQKEDNIAQGEWAAALNKDTEAYGGGSFASGGGSVAGVSYSDFCALYGLADGEEAKALYEGSRERESTTINAPTPQEAGYKYWFAHAEGEKTKAEGRASHAEGAHSVSENNFSHAEGLRNKSRGEASHTEGTDNEATAPNAHAEGELVKVGGGNAHGEGYNTKANGYASHAEGYITTATGDGSHAEGNQTIAEGHGSHAEGLASKARGKYSHAGGTSAEAIGENSFAHGLGVVANKDRQSVFGQYNVKDTEGKYAQIVGWGWGDSSRRNIYVLDINGNAEYAGDVYAKGERLVRFSEINGLGGGSGGGSSTTLYEHLISIEWNATEKWNVCASLISKDASALSSWTALLNYLKGNGSIMASGAAHNGNRTLFASRIAYRQVGTSTASGIKYRDVIALYGLSSDYSSSIYFAVESYDTDCTITDTVRQLM